MKRASYLISLTALVVIIILSFSIFNNKNQKSLNSKETPVNDINLNTKPINYERTVINLLTDTGDTFRFHLEEIPTINQFIAESITPKMDINRLKATTIKQSPDEQLILLHYNCGIKLCAHTLVQKKSGEIITVNIEKTGIFQGEKRKENNDDIVFLFGRNEGQINYNQIIVADLNTFKIIPLQTSEYLNYRYPFIDYQVDKNKIKLTVPNIKEPSQQAFKNWMKLPDKDKKTKEVYIYAK